MKLTAKDLLKLKIIDEVIPEPLGGAHQNTNKVFNTVKKEIYQTYKELNKLSITKILEMRSNRFTSMGVFRELK